ncbi:hypothetical protein ONE63_002852 [Megalurothrips usitatus]|uniref:Uncharacterized protein n=1 Tax=Megalurothrips usitatus TaxID=439358 RepID=A0AAV7X9G0_9NEOP|nr:hypothetical protein ONE63_002852 [Megalurothrips usitatus]
MTWRCTTLPAPPGDLPPRVPDRPCRSVPDAKVVCAALAGCLLAWMVVGVLLLVGIYKRKRQLMWPYMLLGGLNVLGTAGLLLYYASSVHTQIRNMMAMLAFLALQFYLLLHVISLFQRLAAEERQRRVGRADYG